MSPPTLLDFPNELLLHLTTHLHTIEDFANLSSTCTLLHKTLQETLPETLLRLAAKTGPTFFSPHPHFLVLAIARRLALWTTSPSTSVLRETRRKRLMAAFRAGVGGLLGLALSDDVEGVGLTMKDIRRMHALRFSLINPLNDTLDAMIGSAWYQQPNFWSGGAEDAFTLYTDVSSATMQLLIYSSLFSPTTEAFLKPRGERREGEALGVEVRIEFVKYCIPDWSCKPPTCRHDGFEVLPVGPYADGVEDESADGRGNQTALAHLLGGAMFNGMLWKRAWRRVLIAAGAEGNEDGRWPSDWIEKLREIRWRGEGVAGEGGESGGADAHGSEGDGDEDDDEENEDDEDEDGDDDEDEDGDDDDDDEDDGDDDDDVDAPSPTSPPPEPDWIYPSAPPSPTSSTPPDWRFPLFWRALALSPITLPIVAQFKGREEGRPLTISAEQKATILDLRDKVLALEEEDVPGYKKFGKRRRIRVSEAPDLGSEVYWCCAGLWGGL
ncbi:hypothetical protein BU23DRAFT_557415 [Bimuria novae-zelandiae CBS 107.79]|uniref:F-box domain-containing protein n=1 Tax=Bimuria novae-zelandiae CBS 107.79 TaxID=1447943 RepID=A0A6A5UXD7_9PLEO|nr:hypothetical protein BU23DRAFT_557415 [Bimuria novae-zelandiae CBS 107.79]